MIKCFFEGQVRCYFELGDDQHHLVCHGLPAYDDENCFQIDARCLPGPSPTNEPVESRKKTSIKQYLFLSALAYLLRGGGSVFTNC